LRWLSLLFAFQQALWIDVPFMQQGKEGCGSASIWMIMKYWQPDALVDPDQIQRQLYSPRAGGIYARDMVRYFQSKGYRTFSLRADWADLEEQISKGRPLIVCLERSKHGALLHYVVVAGVDSGANLVLVNDPAQRKLLSMSRSDFEQRWRGTDNWTLLAVPELDLASKAFRENNLSETVEHLSSAARNNPTDTFTNDFLATTYFLQNNTQAALKYWNRAGKPQIENIRIEPPLRTDPVLLDRAFAFSRGSILRLSDFEATQAKLSALHVFSRYRMDLSPAASEGFDVTLRAAERSGADVWSWARGLPFQSVNPGFSNIASKAINIGSTLRWDPNKRRAFVVLDTPLGGDPKWGLRLSFDGRDENWLNPGSGFRMKKTLASAEIRAVPAGRWSWTSGAAVSDRHFSNGFAGGVELKYTGSVSRTLLRDASRHFEVSSSLGAEAGKLWSRDPVRFARFVNATDVQWRSLTSKVQIGTAIGRVPFDERFVIGLERDSDLWLRAHAATVDGRKNAANMSRSFVVTNSDFQKEFWNTAWFKVSTGPFIDTGKSSISSHWLIDTGLELRLRILESFGINVSYGRSLSDNHHSVSAR